MKVIAIAGSPRPGGNTNCLVDQALEEIAAHGLETEKIVLSQHRVNPCLGHEDCASFLTCKQNDDAPRILEKFISADGIILSSPVYYYDVTAQMKAFIDRNYFLYTHETPLKASCAGLIAIGGGGGTEHVIRALKRFLKIAADIPNDRIVTLTGHADNPGEVRNNPALVNEARALGSRIVDMLNSTPS